MYSYENVTYNGTLQPLQYLTIGVLKFHIATNIFMFV